QRFPPGDERTHLRSRRRAFHPLICRPGYASIALRTQGSGSRVMLVLVSMRTLVMHVVMLALGCEHVRLRIEFANDETEQIGQLHRVPPPGAITYAFDLHQRQRPKTAAQGRDDSGPGGR